MSCVQTRVRLKDALRVRFTRCARHSFILLDFLSHRTQIGSILKFTDKLRNNDSALMFEIALSNGYLFRC